MFEKEITSWFKKNRRDLPWRKTDAWGVLVSEFMLQQTPVNRVLPIYEEWMKRWPTASSLSKATPASSNYCMGAPRISAASFKAP